MGNDLISLASSRPINKLLADGIVRLIRALASLDGTKPEAWAETHDLSRHLGSTSIKAVRQADSASGEAQIDWGNVKARQSFLSSFPCPSGAPPRMKMFAQYAILLATQTGCKEVGVRLVLRAR